MADDSGCGAVQGDRRGASGSGSAPEGAGAERKFVPRSVTVVGLGAIGGSVARAVRTRLPGVPVNGIDPDARSARRAAGEGVRILVGLDHADLGAGAIVFATPLDTTLRLIRQSAPLWARAALVTDTASLKAPVLEAVRAAWAGDRRLARHPVPFVGAHPMCGTERSGYEAARADLFHEADLWLCADSDERDRSAPRTAYEKRAEELWSVLGARPRWISPADHDRQMAWASHLPQLLASTLAATLADAGLKRCDLGPGGRDMTRLAASSPTMWTPLIAAAARDDAKALRILENRLARLRTAIAEGRSDDLAGLLNEGREWTAETD